MSASVMPPSRSATTTAGIDLLLVEPLLELRDLGGLGGLGQERGVVVLGHLRQLTGQRSGQRAETEPGHDDHDREDDEATHLGSYDGEAVRTMLSR